MSRGDVVIVAAPGDYGKPRPAVIVQSDALSDAHASVRRTRIRQRIGRLSSTDIARPNTTLAFVMGLAD